MMISYGFIGWMDVRTHYGLALKSSPLGIFMPCALIPDGLFAVMLSLGLVERLLVGPRDRKETVHAN
jgi:hypothetical protein